MSNNATPNDTPQICLWNSPAPRGWRIVRMSDVFSRVLRKIDTDNLPVLTISAKIGFMTQEERYSRFMAGESLKRYIQLHRGEFAYNKGNSQTFPHGCVYPLNGYDKAAVPHVYFCFRSHLPVYEDFFAYYFASGALNEQLARINNTGVRNNGLLNISAEQFFTMEIPLPPFDEQRRIAAVLRSVDDAMDAAQAVSHLTRTVRQTLLQELLVRGIGHKRFKPTQIGNIPATWELTTIGQLCDFSSGNGFRPEDWSDTGLPIIRIQNLNGSRNFNYFAGEAMPRWLVERGTLLFSWAGVKGVSFGPHVWTGPRGVLNQHIYRVTPKPGVSQDWLYAALQFVTRRIEERAHGFKSSLVHVRKADITGQVVGLPPVAEQQQIGKRVLDGVEMDLVQGDYLTQVETLQRGLEQDLLTGRVRVPTGV
jgi:type I restriction enzyme, S subunit